jgi:hypothetical protein
MWNWREVMSRRPPSIALGPPDDGTRTTPDLVIGRDDTPSGTVKLRCAVFHST